MKAYVLHGVADLRYEDIDTPLLKKGEVLLKVEAAGICGSDIPRIYRNGTYHFPTVPGHEFSGIPVAFAEDITTEQREKVEGKPVGVFPLIPCRKCGPCLEEKYEMCKNYGYLGSRQDGGYAEFVNVPYENLILLPEEVTLECAAMLEPMAVSVHAMRKVVPAVGEKVLVYGLGTIGLSLCMFLGDVINPSDIYAVGNKDLQKKMFTEIGIPKENFIDSRIVNPVDKIMEITEGKGVDAAFDCIGKDSVVSDIVQMVSYGKRLMLVGNPASDMNMKKEIYWKILRNQLTLYGTWNSSFTGKTDDDWHYVLDRIPGIIKKTGFSPERFITARYEFENLNEGFELMRDKKCEYVKVMGFPNK